MKEPVRVLFICTANSARSQIAEALLATKGQGRFIAASAGSNPASRVNPLAIQVLGEAGIDWNGKPPKSTDDVQNENWDFVITVCDNAKESCPIFPGHPVTAHWGLPDPAAVAGTESERLGAFRDTLDELGRRLDRLVAIPTGTLSHNEIEAQLRAIE